jgi:hypothetical protein
MSDYIEDDLPDDPDVEPEIVHWMEPRPLSVGAAGLSGAVAGAFVLGALTAVGVLTLMHWLGPEREPAWSPRRRYDA